MVSILGISAFYHDSAAAIVVDGKIILQHKKKDLQEKHDSNYPYNAVEFVLKFANLKYQKLIILFFMKNHF